ncbi:MAG: class I adenylate-forming enzyme family protein [Candidatus Sericytochromatia bacterium]
MSDPLWHKLGWLKDLQSDISLAPRDWPSLIQLRSQELLDTGLKKGDRVLLSQGNHWSFFVDLFALWQCGACPIPVDPQLSGLELQTLATHSGSQLLIQAPWQTVAPPPNCQRLPAWNTLPLIREQSSYPRLSGLGWDDPALILYTSGSTGDPKGVVHSLRSLMTRLALLRPYVPLEALQKSLNLLPVHFGHGLICNCLYPLMAGQTLILMPAFGLAQLSQLGPLIDQEEISFLSSVPTLWKMALRLSAPPEKNSLKLIHCGSAPFSAALRHEIQQWSGISAVRNVYGITETGSWLAGSEISCPDFCDGYVGQGWGTHISLQSEDPEGPAIHSPDQVGQVWVQTPALMIGYYLRPDLNAQAISGSWLNTGDLGIWTPAGGLVLVGRKRHEINKAGLKIWPEDIDRVLERHPAVADVCSFAIPDHIAGQEVGVALVLNEAHALNDVKSWLKTQISAHKQPLRWFVCENIPRSSRGKVNREAVSNFCLSPRAEATPNP